MAFFSHSNITHWSVIDERTSHYIYKWTNYSRTVIDDWGGDRLKRIIVIIKKKHARTLIVIVELHYTYTPAP